MKKLTLDFNERQEEEEFQDLYGGVSEMRYRKILNIFIEIYDMSYNTIFYVCRQIVQLFTTSIAIAEVVFNIPKVFQTLN